jgi:hypothetical protein
MTFAVRWHNSPTDRFRMVSPIGLRPIDDLTGASPIGNVACSLFLEDTPGHWRPTEVRPTRNASGMVIFPGLGRIREVDGTPPRHYRAVIAAEFYRPFYAGTQDGIEFDVSPYNDDRPPAQAPQLIDLVLVPATNYPFAPHLRVLRGNVRNSARPVASAEVSRGNTERTLSDERGEYALPLRVMPNNVAVTIDAVEHRTGRQGQISITLPADLGKNNTITIA